MLQLPNIHVDTFVDSASVDERKQVIKILEANEWDMVYPKRSFKEASGINLYVDDKRFQITDSNLFKMPVVAASDFITANEI